VRVGVQLGRDVAFEDREQVGDQRLAARRPLEVVPATVSQRISAS